MPVLVVGTDDLLQLQSWVEKTTTEQATSLVVCVQRGLIVRAPLASPPPAEAVAEGYFEYPLTGSGVSFLSNLFVGDVQQVQNFLRGGESPSGGEGAPDLPHRKDFLLPGGEGPVSIDLSLARLLPKPKGWETSVGGNYSPPPSPTASSPGSQASRADFYKTGEPGQQSPEASPRGTEASPTGALAVGALVVEAEDAPVYCLAAGADSGCRAGIDLRNICENARTLTPEVSFLLDKIRPTEFEAGFGEAEDFGEVHGCGEDPAPKPKLRSCPLIMENAFTLGYVAPKDRLDAVICMLTVCGEAHRRASEIEDPVGEKLADTLLRKLKGAEVSETEQKGASSKQIGN